MRWLSAYSRCRWSTIHDSGSTLPTAVMAEQSAWQGHAGVALDTVNGFTVIDCDACAFKHIVPIPTPAELEHVYGHEYYATEKPLYIEWHLEDRDWLNLAYAERYELFERELGAGRRTLLDVGS